MNRKYVSVDGWLSFQKARNLLIQVTPSHLLQVRDIYVDSRTGFGLRIVKITREIGNIHISFITYIVIIILSWYYSSLTMPNLYM